MNRMLGRMLAGIALVGASTAFSSACVDGNGSIFVYGVMRPPAVAGGLCVYEGDPAQPILASGTLDAAFSTSYEPRILIGSQITARASAEGRAETARIIVQGATVSVTDSAGNEISSFTRLSTTTIEPGTPITPSYRPMALTLIDPTTVQDALRSVKFRSGSKRYVASVRIFGTTLGGRSVDSDAFQFPVDICLGCLIRFTAEARDTAKQTAQCGRDNCAATSDDAVCAIGQDEGVPCNICQGNPFCDPTYNPVTNQVEPIRTKGDPEDCAADSRCCETAVATP